MAIERVEVLSENLAMWGVEVLDYEYQGVAVDFQNLMIKITEKRAVTVEGEIKPMSTRMKARNANLGYLGDALAAFAEVASQYDNDTTSGKSSSAISESAAMGLRLIGYKADAKKGDVISPDKAACEKWQQMLKTKIDGLNNAGSKDMTRLQSLVDKRDESYSTASSLMQSIGDTRANTIKNM